MNSVMGWARTEGEDTVDCSLSNPALGVAGEMAGGEIAVGEIAVGEMVRGKEEGDVSDNSGAAESTLVGSERNSVPMKDRPRTSALADASTQTERHPLELEAETLALSIVRNRLGVAPVPEGRVGSCLHRCVSELLQRHAILFTGMVRRLAPQPDTAYATFRGVAQELFSIGPEGTGGSVLEGVGGVTWGRLVALFAFAARLSVYCSEQRQLRHLREEPAYFLAQYVGEAAIPFLQANGGWEGVCQHFPAPDDLENRIWRTLLVAGLGLGLAATFLATHS